MIMKFKRYLTFIFCTVVCLVLFTQCKKDDHSNKQTGNVPSLDKITPLADPTSVIPASDWITVNAGTFTMGTYSSKRDDPKSSTMPDELPAHQVSVNGFLIDKYEITIGQYLKFCDQTGWPRPEEPYFKWGNSPDSLARPIVN